MEVNIQFLNIHIIPEIISKNLQQAVWLYAHFHCLDHPSHSKGIGLNFLNIQYLMALSELYQTPVLKKINWNGKSRNRNRGNKENREKVKNCISPLPPKKRKLNILIPEAAHVKA